MAGSKVYVDLLVLSEFINRFARLEHQQSHLCKKTFKDFRRSSLFGPAAQGIANETRRILQHSHPLGISFDHVDMDALLLEFEAGQSDFNDEVFAAFCKEKGFTLVTHDGDYRGKGIPILTANQHLLQPGP
jgi:predicted nucleic acid-binding protein